ncbi:MAG: acetyl-CoA carboxylase, carboxyltransferase subunit beta [Armatimonadota bacterium]
MARNGWFRRRSQAVQKAEQVPEGLWTKCPKCEVILFVPELEKALRVCGKCGYHYRLGWQDRLRITVDEGSFQEMDREVQACDPLNFPEYREKLEKGRSSTGLREGFVTGQAAIHGFDCIIGVADFSFMGGSMGSSVGEKIVRAMEKAIELRLPVIMFTASGGARMQEGLLSLMQMAKTAAGCARLMDEGIPYSTVFTDPTMAGVHASYASVGDIIISEPGALVGFAGQRVAAQAQVTKVPENFQRAEFQLEHGMVDLIVPRREMRDTLGKILRFCAAEVTGDRRES